MPTRLTTFTFVGLMALAAWSAFAFDIPRACAHGHQDIGPYQLVIGFHNEPAYQGEPNGLDLMVTKIEPHEHNEATESTSATAATTETKATEAMTGTGSAVATEGMTTSESTGGEYDQEAEAAGAEDHEHEGVPVEGLADSLQAEIIFGSAKRTLKIEPQWGKPGAYTAYILPTQAGDYTWHIFGDIEGTPVDISMTSGSETFGAVEPKTDLSFPEPEPSAAELTGRIETLAGRSQMALGVGGLGVLLALVALVLGRRGGR